MSTLLRAVRNYSTTASSGCHGSPVMILKQMIDKHFTEAAAAATSPVSPVNLRLPLNTVCHVRVTLVSFQHITFHLLPYICMTLNCCLFPVSTHVSILAASLLPLQQLGTPFLLSFVVASSLTVFGTNSNLSSITLLSGLLNAPPHPAPLIRRVSLTLRILQIYLFTYLCTTTQFTSYAQNVHHRPKCTLRGENQYNMVVCCGTVY